MNCNIGTLLSSACNPETEVCIWGTGNVGTHSGFYLLEKRGIKVDYFIDSNSETWGKEVIHGIKCISPEQVANKNVICFILVSHLYCKDIYDKAIQMGMKNIITYSDLTSIEVTSYFDFQKRNQIAIYTCILGNYDELLIPDDILPNCDYYIISDTPLRQSTFFKYINVFDIVPEGLNDLIRINRYCKINAHKIFPDYKYSVYFDGNFRLRGNITEVIKLLPKTRIISFSTNYYKNIYEEAMRAIEVGRDNREIITKQVEKYWLEGMPEDFGSVMCGLLIREHNNPICKKIMEDWWEQVRTFSKKDQISFPYVLWKNGYSIDDIKTINTEADKDGQYWLFNREHKRPRGC